MRDPLGNLLKKRPGITCRGRGFGNVFGLGRGHLPRGQVDERAGIAQVFRADPVGQVDTRWIRGSSLTVNWLNWG